MPLVNRAALGGEPLFNSCAAAFPAFTEADVAAFVPVFAQLADFEPTGALLRRNL